MIFRAIFWIGLVSFLMPHEPDVGFGRPASALASILPSSVSAMIPSGGVDHVCTGHRAACAGSLSLLDGFQAVAIRSLEQVRADLDANRTRLH